MHYQRWRSRGGDIKNIEFRFVTSQCTIVGCERIILQAPRRVGSYCRFHQDRVRRNGNPGSATPPRQRNVGLICKITICSQSATSLGWCDSHYYRWRYHGDPLMGNLLWSAPVEERFWAKVDKHGPRWSRHGYCWVWTGVLSSGYGSFRGQNQTVRTHLFAYEQLVGPVPKGLVLDHLCRNRACVRPSHLEPVTHAVNIRRGGNAMKTHCKRGHPLIGSNLRRDSKGRRQCRACDRIRDKSQPRTRSAPSVLVGFDHELADVRGHTRLHRLVWYNTHGSIPKGNIIHHKDGNPQNNRLSNLACMTRSEHQRLHHTGRRKRAA